MQPALCQSPVMKRYQHTDSKHVGITCRLVVRLVDVCADPNAFIVDKVSAPCSIAVPVFRVCHSHQVLFHIMQAGRERLELDAASYLDCRHLVYVSEIPG